MVIEKVYNAEVEKCEEILPQNTLREKELKPHQIVAELDRYVIAQEEAKRAVAIAMRNRMRRLQVSAEMRDEITPKNIIMIGPTGVGKTEISRRLAKLAKAPFVKVEASKFTEVGYVGRDVESIVRDLVEVAHGLVREEERKKVLVKAETIAEEELLDLLLPESKLSGGGHRMGVANSSAEVVGERSLHIAELASEQGGNGAGVNGNGGGKKSTREKLRELLRQGKLDERLVEVEVQKQVTTHLEIIGPPGFGEVEGQIKEMFSNFIPRPKDKRKLPVRDARKVLIQDAQESLIEHEQVARLAVRQAEQTGIVFIDEIDKICTSSGPGKGPDVSREGVQRDLLPLVEGCTVSTKYGPVRTDHILFIASGAFHFTKPSDLMPEFQGRFPIRVELKSLSAEHFVKILTEPKNALTKQYSALLSTEGVDLIFTADAVQEIAHLTAEVNSRTENIGARRLHTLLEKVLEDLSFAAHEQEGKTVKVTRDYVQKRLANIVEDVDLSRFIL